MTIRLDGRVAVVTGAGGGLGRAHALALASRGAKVVVNDVRAGVEQSAAELVVQEIRNRGGAAIHIAGSVTDKHEIQALVAETVSSWGRIDILVNNAGILRDRTFAKMTIEEFREVVEVHLFGAAICSKAVWPLMQEQNYGRIVMTTSSSGLFGNFGQANYSAAKMSLVGLMKTLALEGAKSNIRVNCFAPTAATRMTDGLMPVDVLALLRPEAVSPGVLMLVAEDAPSGFILNAGAGAYSRTYVTLTRGIYVPPGPDDADVIAHRLPEISCRDGELIPASGAAQVELEIRKARAGSSSF